MSIQYVERPEGLPLSSTTNEDRLVLFTFHLVTGLYCCTHRISHWATCEHIVLCHFSITQNDISLPCLRSIPRDHQPFLAILVRPRIGRVSAILDNDVKKASAKRYATRGWSRCWIVASFDLAGGKPAEGKGCPFMPVPSSRRSCAGSPGSLSPADIP